MQKGGSIASLVPIAADLQKKLKQFRFSQEKTAACLILCIDRKANEIVLDQEINEVTFDRLREELPEGEPRYIVYRHVLKHTDGHVNYPLCLIFHTPRDIQVQLQLIYATSVSIVGESVGLTKSIELRDVEDMSEEWLIQKLRVTNV